MGSEMCIRDRVVEEAILSTDLALYFRKKDLFLETANKGEIDWQGDKKNRKLLFLNNYRIESHNINVQWLYKYTN